MGVQLTAKALLLILLVSLPLPAVAWAACANEPAGSAVQTDWPFNTFTGSGWTQPNGVGSADIFSDGSAPVSPSNVYRQIFYNGMMAGGSPAELYYNYPTLSREIYVCFRWKASTNFEQHGSGRTKIAFVSDTGGNPLFFYLGGGPPGNVHMVGMQHQGGQCNGHISGFPGTCGTWDMAGSTYFDGGNWVEVEGFFKMSTTGSSQDGILRFWVNGILQHSYTNWNSNQALYNGTPIVPIWGGVGGVKTQTDTFSYDHWKVSVPNCASPCGSGGGDTTPPSQVTGLGVAINGTTATLSWTAATDNVAVSNYLVEKCTPSGCSNFLLDQTVSGLSATLSGLTANVSYAFRVRAQDTASNIGPYSETVTATTTGTVERTLATDPFDRANGALGANWTGSYTGMTNLAIASNAVIGISSSAVDNAMSYSAISPPADQWAQVDVSAASGSDQYVGGVTLRMAASPTASFYACRLQSNGWTGPAIEKFVNGTYNLLTTSATNSFVVGDKLKCTARGSAITMSRIRSSVETVILTATDSTFTSGKTGISTYGALTLSLDNFTTGDWAVPDPPPTITAFTPDTTGAGVTWTGPPAYIRVQTYTATGIYSDVVEPIASFPSGRYTRAWEPTITSGCLFAQDANHVDNTTVSAYRCNTITPAQSDTTPPVLSGGLPTGTLNLGTTSTSLSITTNESATCKWHDTNVAYASMANTFSTTNNVSHSATKSGLSNGTSYTVYVRCSDTAGNANTSSTSITFSVDSAPASDTTAPSTVTGLACSALSTSQIQCTWTAATDNVAVASYRLLGCLGTGCTNYSVVHAPTTTSGTAGNLTIETVYAFVVDAVDTSGNVSAAHSTAVEVTTLGNSDIVPPGTMANLRETAAATYSTASLGWNAGTDNVAISQSLIERCQGETCTDFQTVRSLAGSAFSDSTVKFGTTYRYRGKHRDTSGNVSTNYSNIVTVVVPNPPAGVIIGTCPCKTH